MQTPLTVKVPKVQKSTVNDPHTLALPIDRDVAIYYRQSCDVQVGNTATIFQKSDLKAYLQSKGWRGDQIILIDEDEGVSGTRTFEERKGASRLYDLILKGSVGAVCVVDIDRLARDRWMIEISKYIRACMDNHVITLVYNGRHEETFNFHGIYAKDDIHRFKLLAERAAEYLDYAIGRMNVARDYEAKQGHFPGGKHPLGFILQPIGNHKYQTVPFEPHAEIIRAYFYLLDELRGNLQHTRQKIKELGLYVPTEPTNTQSTTA